MKVSFNSNFNPQFYGRNSVARTLSKVCEEVNRAFPYVSPSRETTVNRTNISENFLTFLRKKQAEIMAAREKREEIKNPILYFKTVVNDVKKIEALNCGEHSMLTYMTLKANGIEDCCIGTMITENGRQIKHNLVLVGNKGKDFVVDSWLGITGKKEEVMKLYNTKYASCFEMVEGESFKFAPVVSPKISAEEVPYITDLVPQVDKHRPKFIDKLEKIFNIKAIKSNTAEVFDAQIPNINLNA